MLFYRFAGFSRTEFFADSLYTCFVNPRGDSYIEMAVQERSAPYRVLKSLKKTGARNSRGRVVEKNVLVRDCLFMLVVNLFLAYIPAFSNPYLSLFCIYSAWSPFESLMFSFLIFFNCPPLLPSIDTNYVTHFRPWLGKVEREGYTRWPKLLKMCFKKHRRKRKFLEIWVGV